MTHYGTKILKSAFQSTTLRTAGFYSVPQNELTSVSKLLAVCLMFIGGSPAGTAGGIKTVTMGVLVREPKKGSYYSAQNALPVFKEIIDMLVVEGYLTHKEKKKLEEIDQKILDSIED